MLKLPAFKEVRDAPEPEKPTAVRIPVLGTKDNCVELVLTPILPLVAVPQKGYTVEALALLFVTATLVALVAVVAVVAAAALPPIDKLAAVPVRPVPAPVKLVALKTPVDGLNVNLLELVLTGMLPVLAVPQ